MPDGALASCVGALTPVYSRQLFTCKNRTKQCDKRCHAAWFLGHAGNAHELAQANLVAWGNRVGISVST